ncbi:MULTISPECIES: phytoene desaturase family protein [unclassified Pseudonocardia]|uniref:phytoene desaturase family protein n=1 Tax=unclassified Pseudonocardia TaxID=2619320 RepID=UPI0001FFE300|nr:MULTISPECIES: phytoene desaturase family protein [unclassified Pseudonocardia]ALE74094.1 phytoene dehydrogenase [Pseudonocardia sp. EC080625-04]ALL77504.1 phytoene dehydrogenase [Pseudonocardia sp. EC080610-09]ALL80420.1 phytoene dehydrogenase [Pseudonocardia sp. EC080619-01]OLM17785.1 Phytoene dehydrogenase [Pseudonocardia sp. Ae707_Ps1]
MRRIPGRTDHVVVVGAGLAGLSAALHLLGAGRRVTIVEREDVPGGRAGRLDVADGHGTYRLDTGPTVLTMPELFESALAAVGETTADRLDLVRLDPAYRAEFADGSAIAVHTDAAAMEHEIRETCGPDSAAGYRRLRRWLTDLYRAEMDSFIGANMDSPFSLLGPDLARLAALGGFGRLGRRIGRFLPDERLRRIFSFQALYAGVAPQDALGAYGVIAYMDTVAGVWFPRGGMRAMGDGLAGAAADAGADIHYGRTVTGLVRSGDRVTAVRHAGADGSGTTETACDAVVLTPELPAAYELLGGAPRRPLGLRWSPSAVVVHAGAPAPRPGTAEHHHTISFGAAWEGTFREIIDDGRLMSDPSLLVTRPGLTDPSLQPAGREVLSVLAPCPNTDVAPGLDWERVGPAYAEELFGVLADRGLLDPGTGPSWTRLWTPQDWARAGMAAGTPFSASHTLPQTGPFRPRNLVPGTANAVLAGCGTTPGVGIPPVLISGRLAAERITGPREAEHAGHGAGSRTVR